MMFIIIPNGELQKKGNYFVLLSPNRTAINDKKYFNKEELLQAAQEWSKSFEEQGYYPHFRGHIPHKHILQDLIVMECDATGEHYDDFEFYWLLSEEEQFSYVKVFLD